MKTPLAIFLLCFWGFLPVFMMLANTGGFTEFPDSSTISFCEGLLCKDGGLFHDYLEFATFTFPELNFILGRVLNLIQIISILVAYLLIREG